MRITQTGWECLPWIEWHTCNYNEWIWGHGVIRTLSEKLAILNCLVQGRNSGSNGAYQDNKTCGGSTICSNIVVQWSRNQTNMLVESRSLEHVFFHLDLWNIWQIRSQKHFQSLPWLGGREANAFWTDRRLNILLMLQIAGSFCKFCGPFSTLQTLRSIQESLLMNIQDIINHGQQTTIYSQSQQSPMISAMSCRFLADDTPWHHERFVGSDWRRPLWWFAGAQW